MSDLLRRRIDALETENDLLRLRVAELEDQLFSVSWYCPLEFGLTASEATILAALISRERCSKEFLFAATSRPGEEKDTEIKIIDVWVCKIRRKLTPFGIEIKTLWGHGYMIEPATRELLKHWDAPREAAHG